MDQTTSSAAQKNKRNPTAREYLGSILASVWWPGLLIVLVWGVALAVVAYLTIEHSATGDRVLGGLSKGHLESVSPWVLGIALVISLGHYLWKRESATLWLAGIVAVFFCRELHFAGTSAAVYIGIVILFLVTIMRPAWTRNLLTSRRSATPLAMVYGCYFFAVSLDGR